VQFSSGLAIVNWVNLRLCLQNMIEQLIKCHRKVANFMSWKFHMDQFSRFWAVVICLVTYWMTYVCTNLLSCVAWMSESCHFYTPIVFNLLCHSMLIIQLHKLAWWLPYFQINGYANIIDKALTLALGAAAKAGAGKINPSGYSLSTLVLQYKLPPQLVKPMAIAWSKKMCVCQQKSTDWLFILS
jgi:hypothetical protein